MFKYVINKKIDYRLWDNCIEESINGKIYALSWYLDIVSPGWDALIYEEEGKYIAAFPVTLSKKFAIPYLHQPVFAQQLGLFYKNNLTIDEEDISTIFSLLNKKFLLITDYCLNIDIPREWVQYNFEIKPVKNYQLDLSYNYNFLLNNYQKNRQAAVLQAQRNDLEINYSQDIEILIKMFNENIAYKITGVKDNDKIYNKLRLLFVEAKRRGLAQLLEVKDSGKILGLALFFRFRKEHIYFFSAVSKEGKDKKAIIFLLDHFIQQHCEKDLILDFKGSDVPGIANFYRRFGAEEKHYFSIKKNDLPPPLKAIKKLRMNLIKFYMRL